MKHELKTTTTGFDSAKLSYQEDYLNRWDFAKEIYDLAITTPKAWSVRISIYGSWGEGKSVVLNYIQQIAKADNQIILEFNPWEYQTAEELWESFALSVYQTLKDAGIKIRLSDKIWFNIKVKIKRFFRKSIFLIEPISKFNVYTKSGILVLKNFLHFNKRILNELPQYMGDKRFIILIDDLDRSNPDIIPQILYSLKELLDIPGFSFVLAFDPDVINNTLKAHNVNYGESKDFLDKIIDFPRWLPKANNDELSYLLKKEGEKHVNFLPVGSLENVFTHLPKNPRKLKQFIRSLLSFKNETERYDVEELNWHVLLLINVLKFSYPSLTDSIIQNQKIWDSITTDRWFGERRDNSNRKKEHEEELLKIINEKNHNKDDRDNILEIIKDISNSNYPISVGALDSYTYLTEKRSPLTWKEFNTLINNFEKESSISLIENFMGEYPKPSTFSREDFLKVLFQKTVEYQNWSLGMASDTHLEEYLISHVKDASLALRLLATISFDMGGFVGKKPFLDISKFRILHEMITRWTHFTMPDIYKRIRQDEKELLLKICHESTIDLILIMNFLQPWFPFRTGVFNSIAEEQLSKELGKILEERISYQLFENFKKEGWIESIFIRDKHIVEHYILLRKNSCFWTCNLRDEFFKLLNKSANNTNLILNMASFESLITVALLDEKDKWSVIPDADSILHDHELITIIWETALRKKINPRMFKSQEEYKDDIRAKTGIDLPLPSWWEEMKNMVEDRKQSKD